MSFTKLVLRLCKVSSSWRGGVTRCLALYQSAAQERVGDLAGFARLARVRLTGPVTGVSFVEVLLEQHSSPERAAAEPTTGAAAEPQGLLLSQQDVRQNPEEGS